MNSAGSLPSNPDHEASIDDSEDAMMLGLDDRSARVVSFLSKLRGLGHLDDETLDVQLHSRRFELLQLRQEIGGDGGPLLPSRLPSHRDIHSEVLYGKTPKIHQIVAHVLYPEQVPWPNNDSPSTAEVAFRQTTSIDDTLHPGQEGGLDSTRDAGIRRSQNNSGYKDEMLSEVEQKKAELSRGLLWLQRKRSAGGSSGQRIKTGKSPKSAAMEVELRGQVLSSTVKGYACVATEEVSVLGASGIKDETRQERLEIEREAKLEEFREKKLLEKIKELEKAKEDELKLQDEIASKEERRRKRNVELKKVMETEMQKKFEQEREEAEQKKKEKINAEEKAKKIKQYHGEQKDKLAEWWHQKNESTFSGEPMPVMDKPQEKAKKRTPREATQKQKEAELNAKHLKWSMEERPPLPPRAHDLKGPPLTDRDVFPKKQSVPMSWEVTAKAVSGAYGLTKKERACVTERTLRGVAGAGRMAAYDL